MISAEEVIRNSLSPALRCFQTLLKLVKIVAVQMFLIFAKEDENLNNCSRLKTGCSSIQLIIKC